MRRSLVNTFFSLLVLLFLQMAVVAQSERGAIVGLVTDSTGALVPGASVTITNLGNKTSQTLTTNDEGRYEAPFLIPATYEVSATAPGFAKTVNNNVVVNVGQRVSINLELRAGGFEGTVQVIDAAALLQTETASIGQIVDNKQLTELPSGDRNIYSFILLNSNVNQPPGGNGPAFRLESGGSFSISGTRPSTATFKIDGLSNTDPTFGTPTITPSLDSVQEFQVQNSAYSAEYEGIGQVNVATKAGTSRVHGSLFEFLRNDKLQPRNPIAALDKDGSQEEVSCVLTSSAELWEDHSGYRALAKGVPLFTRETPSSLSATKVDVITLLLLASRAYSLRLNEAATSRPHWAHV